MDCSIKEEHVERASLASLLGPETFDGLIGDLSYMLKFITSKGGVSCYGHDKHHAYNHFYDLFQTSNGLAHIAFLLIQLDRDGTIELEDRNASVSIRSVEAKDASYVFELTVDGAVMFQITCDHHDGVIDFRSSSMINTDIRPYRLYLDSCPFSMFSKKTLQFRDIMSSILMGEKAAFRSPLELF